MRFFNDTTDDEVPDAEVIKWFRKLLRLDKNDVKKKETKETPKSFMIKMEIPTDCVICLGQVKKEGFCLDCLHIFHANCIRQWMERAVSCPVCRTPIQV